MATHTSSTDLSAQDQQNSRLTRASNTLKYMVDPSHGPRPAHLHTRTFLKSLRYFTIFIFWRLVRYAKYAAVGALVAAVSGTAIGSIASGAAFVVAPTGILGGAGIGLLWAVGKFGWKRARARMGKHNATAASHHGNDPRADERADAGASEPATRMPRADPW